jgi:hypothetical protein
MDQAQEIPLQAIPRLNSAGRMTLDGSPRDAKLCRTLIVMP